jgi:hypothetical protein
MGGSLDARHALGRNSWFSHGFGCCDAAATTLMVSLIAGAARVAHESVASDICSADAKNAIALARRGPHGTSIDSSAENTDPLQLDAADTERIWPTKVKIGSENTEQNQHFTHH